MNQSINSAYSERSCYRPCTLDYSLEPDVDPSLCVSSLGDLPNYGEYGGSSDSTGDFTNSGDCQRSGLNETECITDFTADDNATDDL